MAQKRKPSYLLFLLTIAKIHHVSLAQDYPFTTVPAIGVVDELNDYAAASHSSPTITNDFVRPSETILSNHFTTPLVDQEYSSSEDDLIEPVDHEIPYSEHEESEDVSTKLQHPVTRQWGKPPSDKNIQLDFVPIRVYAQVRGTHTAKILPRKEAIDEAETEEEKLNALRLREVVTNSKVNTVYTEEGYEDSAYDHAGHIRDADFHEGFTRKLHDKKKRKKSRNEEGKKKRKEDRRANPEDFEEYDNDYEDHLENPEKSVKPSERLDKYKSTDARWNVDPKLFVENGIEKLEQDVEKEAEEAESGSEINEEQEVDYKTEEMDTESAVESRLDYDYDGGDRPTTEGSRRKKTKRKYVPREKDNDYNEKSVETTTFVYEEPESSSDSYKIENTTNYSNVDTTKLTPSEGLDVEETTTINYSELFWNFFKSKHTTERPSKEKLLAVTTDDYRASDLTNLNHSGSYSLKTQEGITSPSTSTDFQAFDRQKLFIDPVYGSQFHYPSTQDNVNIDNIDSLQNNNNQAQVAITYTLPSSVEERSGNENWESLKSSEGTVSTTPTVSTLKEVTDNVDKESMYGDNPFLNPLLRTIYDESLNRKKLQYKVLVRHKPNKIHKQTKPKSEVFQKINADIDFSPQYKTSLNYVRNRQDIEKENIQIPKKSNAISFEDLTVLRPPNPQHPSEVTYPNFPPNYPRSKLIVLDQRSVPIESKVRQEASWKKLQTHHLRTQNVIDGNSVRPDRLSVNQYGETMRPMIPTTRLVPPAPFANNDYVKYLGKTSQHFVPLKTNFERRNSEVIKYSPFPPDFAERVHMTRKKRSVVENNDDENSGVNIPRVVKGVDLTVSVTKANYTETENTGNNHGKKTAKTKRNSSLKVRRAVGLDLVPDTSVKREGVLKLRNHTSGGGRILSHGTKLHNQKTSSRVTRQTERKKVHEELLNESPKITDEVIDKEIKARFKEEKKKEETKKINDKEDPELDVEVPDFDYIEELVEEIPVNVTATVEPTVKNRKYPYYKNSRIPSTSVLKYILDPNSVPKKSVGGMEFYESRDAYKQCDDVEPNLDDVTPKEEKPEPGGGANKSLPRLRGLGDKLDCFRAKYFDENPFDNPLFLEEHVEEPSSSLEVDTKKFSSRISSLPEENHQYIIQKASRKPEELKRQPRRLHSTERSIYADYKNDPRMSRERKVRFHSVRTSTRNSSGPRLIGNQKSRGRSGVATTETPNVYFTTPYERQIYEDVMGNIKHMAQSYRIYETSTVVTTKQPLSNNKNKTNTSSTLNTPNTSNTSSISNKNIRSRGRGNSGRVLVDIGEHRNKSNVTNNSSLVPAKHGRSKTRVYRSHQVKSHRNNEREPRRVPNENKENKVIGHYQKIRIFKRSAENVEVYKNSINSSESGQYIKDDLRSVDHQESKLDGGENLDSIGILRNDKSSALDKKDQKTENSEKVVYTIRDRIRYSKPKDDTRRFGKFTVNDTNSDEDVRRKEPRYNKIPRSTLNENFTTESSMENNTNEYTEQSEETQQTQRVDLNIEGTLKSSRNFSQINPEESLEAESYITTSQRTTNTYDVYENVQEDVPTTTPDSITSIEHSELKDYLESDPAGYAETFSEDSFVSNPSKLNSNQSKIFFDDTRNDSKDLKDNHEGSKEIDPLKSFHKFYPNEKFVETSEDVESASQSYKQKDESKETDESDEDDLFSRFSLSRASYENKNSEKYTEDKKRPDKPGFFHSPFFFFDYGRLRRESTEDVSEAEDDRREKTKARESHAFPRLVEDEGDDYRDRSIIHRYEYPWERRERLTGERKKRKKKGERRKKLRDIDGDEEESIWSPRRYVYPWNKYDVPSKDNKNVRRRYSDSEESSTEYRPKFSSRYNSKEVKSVINNDSAAVVPTTEQPTESKIDSDRIRETDFGDKSIKGTESNNSFKKPTSRGLIPEDITLAPRRKSRRRTSGFSDIKRSTQELDSNKNYEESTKRDQSGFNESNFKVEVDNDDLKLSTNTNGSASFDQPRNKKRRRVSRKNSIPVVETSTESVRVRRKFRPFSNVISTTVSTTVLTSTSTASPFRINRRRHQKPVDTTTLKSDFNSFEKENRATTKRTIFPKELSRLSKEIVTGTTYSNEDVTNIKGRPKYTYSSRINKFAPPFSDYSNESSESNTKEEKEKISEKYEDSMDDKSSSLSEIPKVKIPLRNGSRVYMEVTGTRESDNRRSNRAKEEATGNGNEERDEKTKRNKTEEESEEIEGKEGLSLLRRKFIKNPEERLYYYVERK